MMEEGTPPLLLIDDIFGELDPVRRNALLAAFAGARRKSWSRRRRMQWREDEVEGPVFELQRIGRCASVGR